MRIVAEEALASFPTRPVPDFATPCGPMNEGAIELDVQYMSDICAVSIVRSGDALLEAVRDVEPGVRVGKILIQRDEVRWYCFGCVARCVCSLEIYS